MLLEFDDTDIFHDAMAGGEGDEICSNRGFFHVRLIIDVLLNTRTEEYLKNVGIQMLDSRQVSE